MKKIKFCSFLAIILVISIISTTTSAFASSNTAVLEKSWSDSSNVIVDGQKIGTEIITYKYSKNTDSQGSSIANVEVIKHYELLPSATEVQKQTFVDENKNYEFKVTNSKEFFVNGQQLTKGELATPITNKSFNTLINAASPDTGGVPAISHYYGDFTNYHLASYSDLTIMGGVAGSNHQADGKISNSYVQRAMSVIDSFSGDYSTMNVSREGFLDAAGLAIITVEGLVTAIAAGVVGVTAAVACYNAFQDCKDDLSKICNYIDLI